jgi:hypothetical protein
MPRIARLLTDAEVNALVAYYASLPAAVPAPPSATMSAKKPEAVVSGPTPGHAAAPAQGIGSEQGAPLSGGTQGVGGPGNAAGPPSGAPSGSSGASPGGDGRR